MTPQERLLAFKAAVQAASDTFGVLLTITSEIPLPDGGVIALNDPTLGYLLLPEKPAPELSEELRAALEEARKPAGIGLDGNVVLRDGRAVVED